MSTLKYSNHMHTLLALISHLALTNRKSITPTFLAEDLGIEKSGIETVLNGFPGIFRKSRNLSSKTNEQYYTLHYRHALRNQEDVASNGDYSRKPLSDSQVNSIINFISNMEQSERERKSMIATGIMTSIIPITCAIIAAYAAVTVAVIVAAK